MGKQIDDLVLLAIIQNQIKNAVDKNKTDKKVITDANGDVTYTDASIANYKFPDPQNFILKSDKYPDVVFYSNYFNYSTEYSIIYRFSSGIILDSSTETPQYKIVLATYKVNTAKVTFVEKVLP